MQCRPDCGTVFIWQCTEHMSCCRYITACSYQPALTPALQHVHAAENILCWCHCTDEYLHQLLKHCTPRQCQSKISINQNISCNESCLYSRFWMLRRSEKKSSDYCRYVSLLCSGWWPRINPQGFLTLNLDCLQQTRLLSPAKIGWRIPELRTQDSRLEYSGTATIETSL